ncbi:MAG: cob(I)yrinic acid a,c-diamide adenosyltransferase [Candidatus Geothermincolia bacterium]
MPGERDPEPGQRELGLLQVYTGDGKGKTTAALGLALRVLGHGGQVFMVQFMKGRTYGELRCCEDIPGITIVMSGRDEFVKKGAPEEVDLRMAREGFELARRVIGAGEHRLVILDELNVALDYGLLPLQEVLETLRARPRHVEIVCTGRYAPSELIEAADLVSEIREIKHYYRQGIPMRQGIEF